MKSILLIGATGLIGRHCLELLLSEEASKWAGLVIVLARSQPPIRHKKLIWETVDFEKLPKYKKRIQADAMISAFGTTIKKTAYDKNLFYHWEVDYPLTTAKIAFENGCRHFSMVSAVGVKKGSPFFYNRTKAKMQALAEDIGFESLDIFQPSLLLGQRTEHRRAEKIFSKLAPLFNPVFIGPLQKYAPVEAADVARAMVRAVKNSEPGLRYHTKKDIMAAALK